jgi:hypothetical protein
VFNANCAIFQLHHGENNLPFDDDDDDGDDILFVLC